MTLEDLHRTVVEGFGRIDERFARIEDRLAQNEARWEQNEARWEQNEARWEQNEARWLENDARLREIGETTRRHFEAVAEQMQASVRIIAEGHAHLIAIRDNHESRLQTLEKRS
jgi:chromosome segregation ATPase